MTTKSEIKKCDDIELLRILVLNQRRQLNVLSETLVDESKMHISAQDAIRKIRNYLCENDCEVDLNWIKMQLDDKKKIQEETTTISKKEYELLKKHQQEYGILLDTLSDKEKVCEYIKARNRDKYGYFLGIEEAVKVIGEEFKERLKRK